MEASDLVRLAMKQTGAEGPTGLADQLGMPGRHAHQTVARWLKGENQPDYEATLALLEAAGLLREKARARAKRERDAEPSVERLLQSLEKTATRLEELAEAIERALAAAQRPQAAPKRARSAQ